MINLGVIGYGWQGAWDTRQMTRIDGFRPGAAFDIDPERVKAAVPKPMR